MRVSCALLFLISICCASKIKHVVVLMEENRSFDHMFGWYPGVNGLKGNECNQVSTMLATSKRICVDKMEPEIPICDPDHSTPATTDKVFGALALSRNETSNATMSGFVEWENRRGQNHTNYCNVMSMLTPQHVPVISALASEFAVMDRFFAAHPGPTWPNRLFMLSATSAGDTETGIWYQNKVGQMFPQKTIFDQVAEAGLTWRHYYNDTIWEIMLESIAHHPESTATMEQFFEDAHNGQLPAFSWINPRSGLNLTTNQGSNDQHPDHNVALGEGFYKDVYEALRVSPNWNETLFIITYDEHGGYYDHVPTPLVNIPPPDKSVSYPDVNFKFDRLGVRIPTILISPLIPKGTVLSAPPAAQKPTPSSEYTLTSIIATARKLLEMNTGPLTARDAWSATFEQVLSLSEPRTDCAMHLPEPAYSPNYSVDAEAKAPLNDLQKQIVAMHASLHAEEFPTHLKLQGQMSAWTQQKYDMHREKTMIWKKMKAAPELELVVRIKSQWVALAFNVNKGTSYYTISVHNLGQCLDHGTGAPTAGSLVNVAPCYPSPVPDTNRDPSQHWIWAHDSTVKSYTNQSLCLTTKVLEGDERLYLEECAVNNVEQHFAWHGASDGDYVGGGIIFSEYNLGVVNATATM